MKLWLLRPIKNLPKTDNPWNPPWDKSFGFVIRAETKKIARNYACKKAGIVWLDSKYSTCIELTNKGKPGIILEDFWSA